MRQLVPVAVLTLALGLLAAGCGGDDEETTPTTTTPTGLTGVSGASGASGTTGAAGDVTKIRQTLEDAGYTVEEGDPASRVVTLPSGDVEAEEKLDVSGNDLAGAAFVLSFADESDAEAVFDHYETEGTFFAEQNGTNVFAAPEETDLDTLVGAAGA